VNPQVDAPSVPTPGHLTRAGVAKIIHVDRVKVQAGEPAVTVRCATGWLRCCAVAYAGPTLVGQWVERAYPDGPNSWVETRALIRCFGVVEVHTGHYRFDVDWGSVAGRHGQR
jgi:hypothetical protein